MRFWKSHWFWPTAITLAALALRLYRIDQQSLWYDEGLSVALAGRPFARIAHDAAADVHPALYYWLLHIWSVVFGTSELAVRSLSALCGAFVAGLTVLLGRRWWSDTVGVIAGIAAVLSPLALHYGQETRMYAMASLFVALMWLALECWGRSRHWSALAGYTLAALAAIFTHYFMVAFVCAAGIAGCIAIWCAAAERSSAIRRTLGWLGLQITLAATLLPLVFGSRERLTAWSATQEPLGALFILGDTLRVFSRGQFEPASLSPWLVCFSALLVAGLLFRQPQAKQGRVSTRLYAAIWLLVPVGLIALLSLRQPYYQPRFLLPALPAFHLLIAAGAVTQVRAVARLAERVKWQRRMIPETGALAMASAALFLALAARGPLMNEWTNPAIWRDDYRDVARAIAATARPGDALLLLGPGQAEVLDYYLKQPLARYPLPRFRPLDPSATTSELEAIARVHSRIYGVFYVPYEADPAGIIQGWLRERAFRSSNQWFGGIELVTYELGDPSRLVLIDGARFGSHLRLEQGAIAPTTLQPGDAIRISSEWVADQPLDRPLQMFAHLLDNNDRVVAQFDSQLAIQPISAWAPHQPQRGRIGVLVPTNTPPGDYRLVTGVYDTTNGERLTLPDGTDILQLATIQIKPQQIHQTQADEDR